MAGRGCPVAPGSGRIVRWFWSQARGLRWEETEVVGAVAASWALPAPSPCLGPSVTATSMGSAYKIREWQTGLAEWLGQ